jgi:hypothetical protein
MNNADLPANPTTPNSSDPEWAAAVTGGLTKREHFAGLAMQSLINGGESRFVTIAKSSLKAADALLAELDKEDK